MNREKLFHWLLLPGILLGIAALVWLHGAGHSHQEANVFLLNYNSGRPFLTMIFDPLRTDWNLYQARELSYVLDYLDARFIRQCIDAGIPHFLSLSILVILGLTLLAQQLGIEAAFPEIPRPAAILLSLLYLFSSSVAELSFFRSAKPAAALCITVIAFSATALWRRPADWRFRKAAWSVLAAALVLAPLFDRQGAYAVGAFAGAGALLLLLLSIPGVSARLSWCSPACMKQLSRMTITGCAAWGFATLYNLVLAPAVIRMLNGYRPSFAYQHIGADAAFNFTGGFWFLFDNLGHFFSRTGGGIAAIVGVAAVLFGAALWRSRLKGQPPWHPAPWITLAALGGMLFCYNLMTARHAVIVRDDIVHGIYFLPGLAVTVYLIALNLAMLDGYRRKVLELLLVLALCARCVSPWLPQPECEDHLRFHKTTSPRVLYLLKHPEIDPEREIIPFSSLVLIENFRRR